MDLGFAQGEEAFSQLLVFKKKNCMFNPLFQKWLKKYLDFFLLKLRICLYVKKGLSMISVPFMTAQRAQIVPNSEVSDSQQWCEALTIFNNLNLKGLFWLGYMES